MSAALALQEANARNAHLVADLADAHRLLALARDDAIHWEKAFQGQKRLCHLLQNRLVALQHVNERRDHRPTGSFETPSRPYPVRGGTSLTVWRGR